MHTFSISPQRYPQANKILSVERRTSVTVDYYGYRFIHQMKTIWGGK